MVLGKDKHLPLILSVNDNDIVEWWVDASFAVHNDMKRRIGMNMSMGVVTLYAASTKQKINTLSSTHAELVGVSDAMTKILWCKLFLQGQGFVMDDVYVHQDNESAILFEENGMKSVGKASRHIKIRYFFVTDNIRGKEMRVFHCPTGGIITDFFTKSLQGTPFMTHRDAILGIQAKDFPKYVKAYEQYISSPGNINTP